MSFTSNAGPVKGRGSLPSDPGTIQDLVAEARYLMNRADESLRQALAASVAVGQQVAAGALADSDFEEGAVEACIYARLAARYFDHAEFTDSDWKTVNDLHSAAVAGLLRLFSADVRPGTATWRLKNRLRANPLAAWASLHIRDQFGGRS